MKTTAALVLCLGTATATVWDGCAWLMSNSNYAGEAYAGEAASPDDCIAMVTAQCPTATIANIQDDAHGDCYCQYGEDPTPDTDGWMTCVLGTTHAPTATVAPTPKGYRDLDGDGVVDAAAEGQCCAYMAGIEFDWADKAAECGSTLAEVALKCCPYNFLLRYNDPDQGGWDCISFVSEADCRYNWVEVGCQHSLSGGGDDSPASSFGSDAAAARGPLLATAVLGAAAAAAL